MAKMMERTSLPTGTCVLDHVAVRVRDRDAVAAELVAALDVQVIERTDRLTLLGPDFTSGKITLLDAEEGTAPEATRLVSLVLAAGTGRSADAPLVLSCGLVLTFHSGDASAERSSAAPRHSLVGIALRSDDPPIAASLLDAEHGMHADSIGADSASLTCGDTEQGGFITLVRERPTRGEMDAAHPPMLDHIGLRVDDAGAWRAYAEQAGLQLDKWVEAAHSNAAFIAGPDGLLIEYVEHTAPMGDA